MFPVYCVDEGFLGARASRPHNAWHSLGQLLHLDRPATAPWPSFGLAVAVTANVTAARKVALMLSDPSTRISHQVAECVVKSGLFSAP